MKSVQKPLWPLVALSLPQAILFLIFWRIYGIIGTMLTAKTLAAWTGFGLALAASWLGFTGYAAASLIRRKPVHPLAGVAVFVIHLPWLYLVLWNLEQIIPWNIPRWMFFGITPEILLFTFTIPALAYAMILLVVTLTPDRGRYRPLRDVIAAIAIPAVWYFASLTGLRFGLDFSAFLQHVTTILIILSTAVFLFVLVRLVYALLRERTGWLGKAAIPFVLIMPLAGLALNQRAGGIFGHFSHPLYYVLAVLTGVLLVLPAPKDPRVRLALFIARSVVLPFTAYFFLVFLPFMPLAIPIILLAGAGFLILTPLVLGFKHLLALREDFVALRTVFGKPLLSALLALGCAVLPGAWYGMVRNDGGQIQRALAYLYRSEYEPDAAIRISGPGLARALESMAAQNTMGRGIGLEAGERTPYLTPLYNWIVLDNLTLARDRVETLKRVFLDQEETAPEKDSGLASTESAGAPAVKIKTVRTETVRTREAGVLRSRLDLELVNASGGNRAEFAATFALPAGCYITDYYLVVDGRKKRGFLADKRAAVWVYQQVVNERKDPGILVYGSGNQVALRVFPFAAGETRYTGLELVHTDPVTLVLDGREIRLGESSSEMPATKHIPEGAFVSAAAKRDLQPFKRPPAYHFVVDFSAAARGKTPAYLARVADFIRARGLKGADVTVTAANYSLKTVSAQEDWRQALARVRTEGGFYLDRAVKAFLYRHFRDERGTYPVIVAVTDEPTHWRVREDYASWRPTFPESDAYYRLGADGGLYLLSLLGQRRPGTGAPVNAPEAVTALAWPDPGRLRGVLPDDGQGGIVLYDDAYTRAWPEDRTGDWETGLALEAKSLGLLLNPADYRPRELAIIRHSLAGGVMTRLTSYLVLENAAQEAVLREKQRQILATGKVADADEVDTVSPASPEMAEPSLLIVLVLGTLILLSRKVLHPAPLIFKR